ncbi:hypothetical protein [Mucilaginibacter myungsuensis]|uniref:Uncharacterized protein n=1 Tax=Mucilaginibacter myungsuensis TaxID=649104 RepID=A0A929PX08_9SPHI|nr:hypothetical protein [Mucilaginibacter myungsuensis]MBE9662689.1 hypothetical protein [Mucilaginibacter myungsuensis]MDN3598109.1 hypothetical protein [Mucilaginibacter myungsuensis]
MESTLDPKNILEHLQTLLHQIKRLATFAYTESNAFALTLLNRKRMEIEEELIPLVPEAPVQDIHQSRTMKAILLCYKPVRRKLKAIDKSLETYYRDGLAGLQHEVEALIAFVTPTITKLKVS